MAKTVQKIGCVTPFIVEYARMSKTRDDAPTLIPVEEEGLPVNAKILILENVSESDAEDMLWQGNYYKLSEYRDVTKNVFRILATHSISYLLL